jgi:putative redox protein
MSEYKATIDYAGDEFFIGTSPSGHAQAIDVNGDRKAAPTPMEMLLVSVGACTAADVISILQKKRQNVSAYKVEVTADRRDEFPRIFTHYRIHHIVRGTDVSEQAVARAIELSETKYCSVAAAVRGSAEIKTTFEIVDAETEQGKAA